MSNITTQFLGGLTASQFRYIESTVALSLPYSQRQHTSDWVQETITSWCLNDSFAKHLQSGNTLTVPFLINWIKSRNITLRETWAKDALHRNSGMKTKNERKTLTEEEQIIRSTAAQPTAIVFDVDEETQVVDLHISDNTFEEKADIHRTIQEIYDYVSPKINSDLFPQFFDLHFKGFNRQEIAEQMGVSIHIIKTLKSKLETIARQGRDRGEL